MIGSKIPREMLISHPEKGIAESIFHHGNQSDRLFLLNKTAYCFTNFNHTWLVDPFSLTISFWAFCTLCTTVHFTVMKIKSLMWRVQREISRAMLKIRKTCSVPTL